MNDPSKVNSPEYSQPLCTILQLAIVELFRTFDIAPVVVTGHSSGEIAAAFTVGALTHESACKVAYYRGQVVGKLRHAQMRPGGMLSVNLLEEQLPELLKDLGLGPDAIAVACVNSRTNLTLSGPLCAINSLKAKLDGLGIFAHKVNTGLAYHTPAMADVSVEYLQLLGNLEMDLANTGPISMISTVTGQLVTREALATPQYWVNNLVSRVQFCDVISQFEDGVSISLPLHAGAVTDLIEIGPHAALRRPIKDTAPSLRYHSALERPQTASSNSIGTPRLAVQSRTLRLCAGRKRPRRHQSSLVGGLSTLPFRSQSSVLD